MRKTFFNLFILFGIVSVNAQTAENPFAKYGFKKVRAYSFSKGEFEEFHDNKEIVEVGSVLFDTKTNQVVGYINEETENEVDAATSAMTVDPLCEIYPWISPYAYCLNNPIRYVDPDGRTAWDKVVGGFVGIATNIIPGSTGLRTLYSPTDASDYNNTLQAADATAMALGGVMVKGGGAAVAVGGTAVVGGLTVSAVSGGTAAIGGVPVATGGAALADAGAKTALAGGVLMMNSAANASQGYNYGDKSSNSSNASSGKTYSDKTYKSFEKQLQSGGEKSLLKSKTNIEKNLNEHVKKLEEINKSGGYGSSVEREIKTFRGQLDAIDDLLKVQ